MRAPEKRTQGACEGNGSTGLHPESVDGCSPCSASSCRQTFNILLNIEQARVRRGYTRCRERADDMSRGAAPVEIFSACLSNCVAL